MDRAVRRACHVAFVTVPVPRPWGVLLVIFTPEELMLAKGDVEQTLWTLPYSDPRLLGILEKVLTQLGLPARLDA